MAKELSTDWIRVPVALLNDPTVSATEVLIYSVMLDRADQTLTVKISYNELASEMGIHRNTAKHGIIKLKNKELIWTDKTEEQPHDKLTYHLKKII